jgi:hypothetical protein
MFEAHLMTPSETLPSVDVLQRHFFLSLQKLVEELSNSRL